MQNVDSIKLFTKGKHKIVSRMGGTRTFDLSKTPFDDELKQVGAVIATNEKLFEIGKRNNDNTFLLPNGIDLQLFKPRLQRQQPFNNNSSNPFVVGFSGNIDGEMCMNYKGWKYFVQATLRLRPSITTKTMLYKHNQIPHDRMPKDFYHQIDCLVLPSIDEGCSNVVMEALACGVPVLLTKVGFHGERLEDNTNCLFIERDIDSIMSKITLLMKVPELRAKLAFEGRLFAETNHDIDKIAQEYDRIFRLMLEGRKECK